MAKFANVTYGSHKHDGEDKPQYTYLVNDNVRTGDTLYVAARHYGNGAIFTTTSVVRETTKTTTLKGQEMQAALEAGYRPETGEERQTPKDQEAPNTEILRAETGGRAMRTIASQKGQYVGGQKEDRMRIIRAQNAMIAQEQTGAQISSGEQTSKAFETYDEYTRTTGGQIQRPSETTYDEYTRR